MDRFEGMSIVLAVAEAGSPSASPYIREEAGTHRYNVGTDTPKLCATSLGRVPLANSFSGGLNLAVGHPALSAPDASCAPGGLQSGSGALQDQLALHLG